MWTRAQFVARGAIDRALRGLGKPAVSAALLALIVLYGIAAAAWARLGSEEGAEAFATSWPFGALYAVAVLDGLVATGRAAPSAFPEWFSSAAPASAWGGRLPEISRLLFAVAWLLVGGGLATSLAVRDRFTLWAAEGEAFQGAPGQYLTRAPPRAMSPGPKPLAFEVTRVEPRVDADGTLRSLEVGLVLGGRPKTTTRWRPVWLGGGRFLRASAHGYAPRYEVGDASGTVLDTAFVKLALLPPGRADYLRSEALPHRIYVRLTGGEAALGDVAFQVDVFRGKLPVASGILRTADELRFEGFVVRLPEVRYVAELTLIDDPGLLVLAGALAVALAALGLRLASRTRDHGPGAGRGRSTGAGPRSEGPGAC